MDQEHEIDRLYGLPLAEFIAARDGLAKSLRAAGEKESAGEIKRLTKPSVTAWAANAVVHHDAALFEELLAASATLRQALTGKGDRVEAEGRRRAALQALLRAAERRLSEAGHASTPAARQRISHTLEALAASAPGDDGPRPGRLTGDLDAPGFDGLAGLAASLAPAKKAATPARRSPARGKATKDAARGKPSASQRRLEAIQQEVAERQAELAGMDEAAAEAEAALTAADDERRRLNEEAAEAGRRERAAAKAAAAAAAALKKAKAAAGKAKAARRRAVQRLAASRRKLA